MGHAVRLTFLLVRDTLDIESLTALIDEESTRAGDLGNGGYVGNERRGGDYERGCADSPHDEEESGGKKKRRLGRGMP